MLLIIPSRASRALLLLLICLVTEADEPTCSWEERASCNATFRDPKLEIMTANLGNGDEETLVYIERDVATFYNETPGKIEPLETNFRGMFGKFINMSPSPKRIMWQPPGNQPAAYIADLASFGAAGTATYPGHVFTVIDPKSSKPGEVLQSFRIIKGNSLYVYDPFGSKEAARSQLSDKELELYELQWRNLAFNKVYERKTKRQWIALYGRKHAPRYPIWPADYFGQTHTVSTTHTHVTKPLPERFTSAKISLYGATDDERRSLSEYQEGGISTTETLLLNLTMTVMSVAPRVFEIRNFLSEEEIHHLMEIALGTTLARSTTRAGSDAEITSNDQTRTSLNSWLGRERSTVIDLIYRRAADVLQIDEQMFRYRKHDVPGFPKGVRGSTAERLQLVHYAPGQQYTAHHDFSVPNLLDGQPSRFATMLFYLNDVEGGGETSFPRWLNGKTRDELKVKPEPGKAILFYNQLPDGNYDERSQHSALPVIKGEKWLINLWVWDPHM